MSLKNSLMENEGWAEAHYDDNQYGECCLETYRSGKYLPERLVRDLCHFMRNVDRIENDIYEWEFGDGAYGYWVVTVRRHELIMANLI